MIAKITLYNGIEYRIGDKTQDTSDGLYTGRIVEELQLESKMSDKGATPLSLNITIRNDDNFIPNTVDLWAATIELTATNGNKWVGKINFFDFDADGNVYVTASEKTAPELELQLPDEVRQVYTVDNNFHPSSTSMTIPLVVGGTASAPITLSTILINKQNGVYLIGTGEIRQILKVYNGSEELPASAYTAYTGTASQSEHAGFAYVKINEAYRKNADGTYAEINVDIIGLKLGSYSAEECRNPARFLYYFLTTPSSGVNGWGCGISASDIDSASFNSAITLCDTLGYKLDGIMWLRQSAQSWIDQICQTMHASYTIGANGKRTLFIDYAGAASKRTFTENDCKVSRYGKNSYSGQVYNKGVLSYGYNPITGLFMQSAQFEDSASVSQIGEQKFVGESYLIGDASTALKVLEYTCKRSLILAEAIEFETDRLETLLKAGDLITLNFPSRNINAVYQIANISTSEYKSSISAVKFDTSVFTVSGSKTNVAWGNERDITPALTPAQATNLLLSTGFDINQDGTGNPYISGTFTVPKGGWLAAAVQYGIGANPTNYTELALITEGRFKIQPVNVGTVYTVRVRMITATGHSDYITGQITSTGDTVPPAIPTIVLNSTEKIVIVKCAIDNPPSDMGGFQIWRKKHTKEVFTLVGNVAANFGYASFPDHVEIFVEYDYKAKSYDRSGNLSDFSNVVSITPTGIEATELAATALKIPTGAILTLNAKGLDTESIKTAGGVIDGSGFGHHGQAFGGVTVLDGGEGFGFDGVNGYVTFPNLTYGDGVTYVFTVKMPSALSAYQVIIERRSLRSGQNGWIAITNTGQVRALMSNRSVTGVYDVNSTVLSNNTWVHVAVAIENGSAKIYLNGELNAQDNTATLVSNMTLPLRVGANFNGGEPLCGSLSDVRIYPRALSATEVKSMYMLPEDVVLTRVTADLIGANAVNAIHINAGAVTANAVGTNEIIANTANIADGIITNAKIHDLDASKINAGTIAAARIGAGSITAEKLNVEAIKAPTGCQLLVSAKGISSVAANDKLPDGSGRQTVITAATAISVTESNPMGKVFTFNGTSQYMNLSRNGIGANEGTLTAWIYPNINDSEMRIIFYTGTGTSWASMRFCVYYQGGYLHVHISNGTNSYLGEVYTSISINAWSHIAIRYNASRTEILINGVFKTIRTTTVYTPGSFTPTNTQIGYMTYASRYFKGSIAEVRTYSRYLTDTEIKTLYMLGTDTESGQITADRIATDALRSRTAPTGTVDGSTFTNSGSMFNLAEQGFIATPYFYASNNGGGIKKGFKVGNVLLNENVGIDGINYESALYYSATQNVYATGIAVMLPANNAVPSRGVFVDNRNNMGVGVHIQNRGTTFGIDVENYSSG